ncbi:MAG: hypothetical protein JXA51_05960 [Dehalococcoidales bacterium]|nr:hypothetical protein [Dehalococcoidales bacterium]
MKIVLALAIAVILLMVMAHLALADTGMTVYVSVSVDGELLVAAQPVTVTDMTVEAVIKAAHAVYYSDGESGYVAGIDPTFNMYLITRCWGIPATPFVIVNGAPLGADLSVPATVDAAPVAANDNIIISTSSDMMNNPAQPVSLTSTLSGDSATVTATAWTLDFMTFMYSSAPLADASVVDPTTGASLGTTDADGSITVTVPESGIVAVDGLAAINVKTAPATTPAAPAPAPAAPSGSDVTVYVSVSVDGELLVAAQPITVTDMTVQAVIKAAHAEFYSGGESGYTDGIDPMFNMILITRCWGIQATPFVILNGAPLGADPSIPPTVDAAPVVANDNIIICTGSDMMNNPVQPVSLTSTLSGDSATVTATVWTLDFMTFMYSSAPLAGASVVDPTTGASLGTTDADGSITVTVPESGVVAVDGLAAINVKAAAAPAPAAPAPAAPAPAPGTPASEVTDTPIFYGPTISLIIWAVIILTPVLVIVIIKMVRQSRLDKETVHIATAVSPSAALGSTPAGPALGPVAPGPAPSGPAPASASPISTPPPLAPRPTAAPAPTPAGPANVYVSVSVDGKLLVAAQPVTVTEMTVQGVIKAAHAEYYSGGEKGYKAGIDPTFNMFLITKCWGIQATPYVIVNGAPLGANPAVPATVDVAPVAANDNIIICTSNDMMGKPAQPVSLTVTLSGDSATVTATAWTLDFSTFSYSSAPLANANVVDPATGASLGYTDAGGSITVIVPESGVVAIGGLAAIAATPGDRQ